MNKNTLSVLIISLSILAASIFRLIPHPSNFSPVGAMALFGGVYFGGSFLAILIPFLSLFISDLVLNNVVYAEYNPNFVLFYDGFYWVYGSFMLVVALGWLLKNRVTVFNVALGSLASSILFFLVTNFGVWIGSGMYNIDFQGFIKCYTLALPFFSNGILGDWVFNAALFGSFYIIKRRFLLTTNQL
jgi:hypothetical protein